MRLVARHRDSKSEKSVPLGGKTLFGTRSQVELPALPGGAGASRVDDVRSAGTGSVTYDERCVVCDIYVHAHAHAHAAHMRCDMCMHMHTCNMHCACACACTCACACACACVACACIWGSGRSDQSFIPFQSPTRTFAMSLLYFRFRGLVPNQPL